MLKIKDDLFDYDQIFIASFSDKEKNIWIYFRSGPLLIYGPEFIQGKVPRERIITADEYRKIKDYFMIDKKCEVIL